MHRLSSSVRHPLARFGGLIVLLSLLAIPLAADPRYTHQGPDLRDSEALSPSGGAIAGDPVEIARAFVEERQQDLGLAAEDIAEAVVSSHHRSRDTGVTHVYLQQQLHGIPVEGAVLNLALTAEGRVAHVGNRFLPELALSTGSPEPTISPRHAVDRAVADLGLPAADFALLTSKPDARRHTVLSGGGISANDIPASLVWFPRAVDDLRLAWKLELDIVETSNLWQIYVDARDGQILDRVDLVIHDTFGAATPAATESHGAQRATPSPRVETRANKGPSSQYEVFEIPAEYPYENNDPTTAADDVPAGDPDGGRSIVADPANLVASPFGWHDTDGMAGAEFTIPQGNNVHAYLDRDANNVPDAGEPDGGATLDFTGPLVALDLINDGPTVYGAAAAVNLFYWNNIIHDVLHLHGFDEASGNFQENNYGNGGAGSDSVNAEAQDGSGTNNANFGTPSDGSNPRMQMFTWTGTTPNRDGDFSSMIITHEYGHGVSNRLTGGGNNVNCLNNSEQMGEGWSDWLGLVLTAHTGDTGPTQRGVGTYALGEPPDTGTGIRPAPYSTDMGINSFTYGDTTSGLSVPHGIGFVWSTIVWEVYWDLVNEHGFNPDIYGDWTTGGNNLALRLVLDGMKLQACSPGFVDGRDGILMADQLLTGGANECLLWKAFARRGLGESASQGSSGSNSDNSEAFDFPVACDFLGATPTTTQICAGDDAIFDVVIGGAFSPPVTLSTVGAPAGTSSGFVPNPVMSVPNDSQLTLGSTGGLAAGTYDFDIRGDDTITQFDSPVSLEVFDTLPGGISLSSPADDATDVATNPTLMWTAAPGGGTYTVEIARDAGFGDVVDTASGLVTTSYTVQAGLDTGTPYYWRVMAVNPCGAEAFTAAFRFTTVVGPGDCALGVVPNVLFGEGFEAGAGDWTSSAGAGVDTWALASDRVHGGTMAFHADDVNSVSDQYLVSPAMALPPIEASPVTLRFWNYQELEDSGSGCFDGAVLEISTDGTTWTRLEPELLTDPYDGAVSTGFSNPIGGENAWCGDPQDWLQSVVDVDAWAGQTVQFRFRLATDSSVSHPGWWIDDVTLQSCGLGGLFTDGFESGDTSAWSAVAP